MDQTRPFASAVGLCAACLSLGLQTPGLAAAPELPTKRLELYRTATPPLLDGRRNDACWTDAAATGDFQLYQGKGAPENRTRAWATYDAENLYLFLECRDRDMAKVSGKRPQDRMDENIWQEEEIELFFDVNHDRKTYFQLMCSVLGTKSDMASGVGSDWHGGRDRPRRGWRAKTSRDAQAWYAEIAVPFTVLRCTTEFAATPQPGTVWGANFYRHEYRENEWINWNIATRGFHQPTRFGELHFVGGRERVLPAVKKTDLAALDFGNGTALLELTNPTAAAVTVTASLTVAPEDGAGEGAPVQRRVHLAGGATATVELPYRILDGGDWVARLRVASGADVLLVGEARARLPRIRRALAGLLAAGEEGDAALKSSAFPVDERQTLTDELARIGDRAKAFSALLGKSAQLGRGEWDSIRQGVPALLHESAGVVRRLAYVRADNARGGAGAKAGMLVGVHGPLAHVFPDTAGGSDAAVPVQLTAMAGEGESLQVAVMALWDDLTDVRVTCDELRGPDAVLRGDAVKVFLIAYQKFERAPNEPPDTREWFPDVLLPNAPRPISAYMTQPFWVDLTVPRDTPAGMYEGAVTVSAAGREPQQVPVKMRVREAQLPAVCGLHNDFWITTHGPRWWGYDTRSIEGMIGIMKLAQRNRISAMPSFWIELYAKVKITRVGDERYTFDFGEFNEFLLAAQRHGVNSWNPNLECNQGWASYFCGGYGAVTITDAATGEEYEFANRYKNKTIPLEELWTKTPIFEQFWKAYVPSLEAIGMLESAWYESVDEPNDTPRIELLILIHSQLRRWVPELKLLSQGTYPAHHYARGRGYVDAWAPQLGWYWDVREIMQRDQRDNGIMQSIYTCGSQSRNDKGGTTPDGCLRDPNVTRRIVPWMCYKWDIHGYLFYAMNPWPQIRVEKDAVIPAETQPWPTVTQIQKRPVYNLIMPGPEKTFVPTIRLKAFRDGMEDYDYLKMLEDVAAKLKAAKIASELVAAATQALEIGDDIVADPWTYTLDPDALTTRRARIGDLIENSQRQLRRGAGGN